MESMQTMIQGYKTIHKHTHTNIALKTHSGAAGSTEILEKSCLREKQHNAQGCYHGDTLFVEDIKCGCLHCLCVREQKQLLEIQGMCWHAQNTHTLIEQLIHSLSHSHTHKHHTAKSTQLTSYTDTQEMREQFIPSASNILGMSRYRSATSKALFRLVTGSSC